MAISCPVPGFHAHDQAADQPRVAPEVGGHLPIQRSREGRLDLLPQLGIGVDRHGDRGVNPTRALVLQVTRRFLDVRQQRLPVLLQHREEEAEEQLRIPVSEGGSQDSPLVGQSDARGFQKGAEVRLLPVHTHHLVEVREPLPRRVGAVGELQQSVRVGPGDGEAAHSISEM